MNCTICYPNLELYLKAVLADLISILQSLKCRSVFISQVVSEVLSALGNHRCEEELTGLSRLQGDLRVSPV